MSNLKRIAGTVISLTMLASTSTSATTLKQLNIDDMVSEATTCIVGNVVSSTQEKQNGQVYTLTTFNVSKIAFGSAERTITVKTLGGRSNVGRLKTSTVFAGSPRFFIGQERVMLLSHNADANNYSIVGFNQGNFRVNRTALGGSTVSLPAALGGNVNLDQALETISSRRGSPAKQQIGN